MARPRRGRGGCSPADRWRPQSKAKAVCGYTYEDAAGESVTCQARGAHYCKPRADRVVDFFTELLVHTKGPWARQPFILDDWQEHEIVRPLFGEVVWSAEWARYVRRYRVAYIVLARKNGKSELAAGILLYLLVGDDEEAAEVYGAAKDTKQAGKVWEPARRMVELSPDLRARLKTNKHSRRIIDETTASYYEVITADALGELGHNPHGAVIDEVLSQRDGSVWDALRTAKGTRTQPLFLLITTETSEPHSFGADMIDEAERVQADPARAPHVFAFVRKTPRDADPWDEANWKTPNPALGSFLSAEDLRQDALDARNQPQLENAFRQFRLNQRQQQHSRWMPLDLWDASSSEVWPSLKWARSRLKGRRAWGGLDLSSKVDLTAYAWLLPRGDDDAAVIDVVWRFFVPEEILPALDDNTGGQASQWVKAGWLTPTEGNVIDYDAVYEALEADAKIFKVAEMSADPWLLEPVRQEICKRLQIEVYPVPQTFRGMSEATKQTMVLAKSRRLEHGGNPVARWCADSVEVRTDDQENIRPVKPDRQKTGKRIDGMVALINAIDGHQRRGKAAPKSKALYVS